MSHASFAAAFEPAENWYKQQVQYATWGHLAPKKNHTYRGHIVWALDLYDSGYLNPKVLEIQLDGLPDSPWFYDAMIDFLQNIHKEMFSSNRKTFWGPSERCEATAGTIWRWDGSFRNYKWHGHVRRLHCAGLGEGVPVLPAKTRKLTKKDFVKLAGEIKAMPKKKSLARFEQLLPELTASNPRFNADKFARACGIRQ